MVVMVKSKNILIYVTPVVITIGLMFLSIHFNNKLTCINFQGEVTGSNQDKLNIILANDTARSGTTFLFKYPEKTIVPNGDKNITMCYTGKKGYWITEVREWENTMHKSSFIRGNYSVFQ